MKLKNISFCVLIASLILYNHSNASVNEEMNHSISYITDNNTSTDLFLRQNNNSSDVILYPNDNVFELLNNGYSELPVQKNNNPNNIISIVKVNLNKDNINDIVLSIDKQNVKYKNDKSICNSFTTVVKGILLLPVSVYGGIVSNWQLEDNDNIMSNLHDVAKNSTIFVFDDTLGAFMELVKTLCNKTINVSTNIFNYAKAYICRKIWG